ncbi:tetratricopeptide repeat protein [Archangium primigenium]|uniref:tetratricopeptide repeat protein n=1 Tax=[Archangium] primigenium TaxID=2792470 RepID=UPI001958D5A0|nr:tetratricopeptide repeat protein [Archangium primigenium]MBM7115249.1 tetratricopeptide repeat protein [Archangium primigenium]
MLAFLLRNEESSLFPAAPWDDVADLDLPPPTPCEGLGRAHLPVNTRVPQAQRWFDQGLRLLHLGWRGEARRAFAEAARCDPQLAMAWWGLALTRGAGARRAASRAEAIYKALALSEGGPDAEQRYIVAATFLANKGPANGRHGFVREMEGHLERCPEDAEARLLLAGLLADGFEADGRPGPGQTYAQLLVRELLRTHPEHEGVHLAWVRLREESTRPQEALESARRLRVLAPQAAPALLAAGRLFLRTGHLQEAREVLEEAVTVEDAWRARESLPGAAAPVAGVALRLLVQACADAGRYGEAQTWARRLRARAEEVTPRVDQALVFAAGALSGLHLRFGFLRAAAEPRVELSPEARPADRVLLSGMELYARGLRALEAGPLAEADRLCTALEQLAQPLTDESRSEGHLLCPRDVTRVVELAACELRGALEARQGDPARAEATLTRALRLERRLRPAGPPAFSRPVRETLARHRLRLGREEKALELARALVEERPGSGHAWLLLADIHLARGAVAEAAMAFSSCLTCWRDAEAHLPEVQRARSFRGASPRPVSRMRLVPPVENAPA